VRKPAFSGGISDMRRNAIATPSTTLHWQSGDQRRRRSLPALQPGDTLGTVIFRGIADISRQVTGQLVDEAADAAAFEGQLSGLAAGRMAALEGAALPEADGGSIHGRAFSSAARAGYAQALSSRMALQVTQAGADAGDDLRAFDRAVDRQQAELSALPADIRTAAHGELALFAGRERAKISDRLTARRLEAEEATDREAIGLFADEAKRAARLGKAAEATEYQARHDAALTGLLATGRATAQEVAGSKRALGQSIAAEVHRGEFYRAVETGGLGAGLVYAGSVRRDPDLTPEAADKLFAELDRTLDGLRADAERNERRAERNERALARNVAKEAVDRQAAGTLSLEWLRANRGRFDDTDYRLFVKAATDPGEAATDPEIYADLRARAATGQDVGAEARRAYAERRLTREAYDKVQRDAELADDAIVKEGAEFIKSMVLGSELQPKEGQAERYALAKDEWNTWVTERREKGERIPREPAKRQFEYIARQYRFVSAPALLQRTPAYLVGTRTEPDIAATYKATNEAFKAGRITAEQAAEQTRIIEELENRRRMQEVAP